MDKKLFGKQLHSARKDCGLTSEKLAEICNLNATYIRQIEAGTKVPSLPVFISLCKELKVSPSYLLVEALPNSGIEEMDILLEIWKRATPKQIKLINSMLKGALDVLDD